MSTKGVAEEVSSKNVLQECQVRGSSKSVPEECQARVSCKSVKQECLTRVSSEKFQVRLSSKGVAE